MNEGEEVKKGFLRAVGCFIFILVILAFLTCEMKQCASELNDPNSKLNKQIEKDLDKTMKETNKKIDSIVKRNTKALDSTMKETFKKK